MAMTTFPILALLLACGSKDGGETGQPGDGGAGDGGAGDGGAADGGSGDGGAGDGVYGAVIPGPKAITTKHTSCDGTSTSHSPAHATPVGRPLSRSDAISAVLIHVPLA